MHLDEDPDGVAGVQQAGPPEEARYTLARSDARGEHRGISQESQFRREGLGACPAAGPLLGSASAEGSNEKRAGESGTAGESGEEAGEGGAGFTQRFPMRSASRVLERFFASSRSNGKTAFSPETHYMS